MYFIKTGVQLLVLLACFVTYNLGSSCEYAVITRTVKPLPQLVLSLFLPPLSLSHTQTHTHTHNLREFPELFSLFRPLNDALLELVS